MRYNKKLAALLSAFAVAVTMSGCSAAGNSETDDREVEIAGRDPEVEIPGEIETPSEESPAVEPETPSEGQPETPPEQEPIEEEPPTAQPQQPVVEPKVKTVSYITVTTDSVNIRSGAGTNYSVVGSAEKSTLYANLGESGEWYKTQYKNKTAYISKKYCRIITMGASENEKTEAVIAEGAKLLGTPYVYGAVRLHDGNGNMYKGFTVTEFDCSSLMQYMFYKGAGKLLQVNTRTQIYQGTTVAKSKLKRGDLIFFTNASRKNNSGIERVGHVAIYLGDNYILHTASDYAKIEQISALRWSYYIQSQRML